MKEWPKDIPEPPSFPATLKKFLSLVVDAKPRRASETRFRDYLREEGLPGCYWKPTKPEAIVRPGPDGKPTKYQAMKTIVSEKPLTEDERNQRAEALLETIKAGDKSGGFFTDFVWLDMALQYKNW